MHEVDDHDGVEDDSVGEDDDADDAESLMTLMKMMKIKLTSESSDWSRRRT